MTKFLPAILGYAILCAVWLGEPTQGGVDMYAESEGREGRGGRAEWIGKEAWYGGG